MQSDAHFRVVDKAAGCKKATCGGKKVASRGKKASIGGKKPAGRGKKVEHNYVNLSGSLFVAHTLPENHIKNGYVSE